MKHPPIAVAAACAAVLASAAIARAQDAPATTYVCPPCGSQCHTETYDSEGTCSGCGMTLVDSTTIPTVAVYVFDGVELSNFAVPVGIFRASNRVLVHTVADTPDEVSSAELVTFTPRYSFDDAPDANVLIVVGGDNIRDYAGDTMVTDWLAEAAESADRVLCVGLGVMLLHPSGALEGKTVPVPPFMAQRMEQFLPGVQAADHHTVVRSGKYFFALNEEAAARAALGILAELTDEETAKRTAETTGFRFQAMPPRPAEDGAGQ